MENINTYDCEENVVVVSTQPAAETPATTSPAYVPVSFDTVGLDVVKYADSFFTRFGSCSQVVKALSSLRTQEREATTDTSKQAYQTFLYPRMFDLADEVVTFYNTTVLADLDTSVLRRQVYGANLNGLRNNGILKNAVFTKGVHFNLRYKFAQFGQLVRLLVQRLTYITERDVSTIKRYQTHQDEREFFVELQGRCKTFLQLLQSSEPTSVLTRWHGVVAQARTDNNVQVKKYSGVPKPRVLNTQRTMRPTPQASQTPQTPQASQTPHASQTNLRPRKFKRTSSTTQQP